MLRMKSSYNASDCKDGQEMVHSQETNKTIEFMEYICRIVAELFDFKFDSRNNNAAAPWSFMK